MLETLMDNLDVVIIVILIEVGMLQIMGNHPTLYLQIGQLYTEHFAGKQPMLTQQLTLFPAIGKSIENPSVPLTIRHRHPPLQQIHHHLVSEHLTSPQLLPYRTNSAVLVIDAKLLNDTLETQFHQPQLTAHTINQ
jgi:hypothetical protein